MFTDYSSPTSSPDRQDGTRRRPAEPDAPSGSPPSPLRPEGPVEGALVAGSIILTRRGLVPIEDVVVGDQVLTHLGRWRDVVGTVLSESPCCSVAGAGNRKVGINWKHPMWARRNRTPSGTRSLQEPTYVMVDEREFVRRWYLASPIAFPPEPLPEAPHDDLETLLAVAGAYWLTAASTATASRSLTTSTTFPA